MEEREGEIRAFLITKHEVVKLGAHYKEKEGEIEEGAGCTVRELESKPLRRLR